MELRLPHTQHVSGIEDERQSRICDFGTRLCCTSPPVATCWIIEPPAFYCLS